MQKAVTTPTRLIYLVLFVFVVINLFIPGEKNNLVLLLSQLVVYGFAGVHLVFLSEGKRRNSLRLLLGLLIFAFAFSYINSFYQNDSLRVIIQLFSMVLLAWLVSEAAPDARTVKITLFTLVAAGVALSIYGLLQVVTYFAQPPDSELVTQILPVSSHYLQQVFSQKRIFSTFLLPTSLSAFLALVLPVAGSLVVEYRKKIWVVTLMVVSILVMGAALIQTQSNGGIVALIGGLVLGTLIILRDKKLPVGWILLGVFIVGAGFIFAIGAIRGNFIWDLGAVNSPVRLRWSLWQAGFAMIARYGLTGIGAGNFQLGFFPYVGGDVRPTKFLHNTYLQIPIELGIIALVAMIAGLFLLFRAILKKRDAVSSPAIQYGLIISILVFLISNSFEIVLYFHSLGYLGAFLIGLFLRGKPEKNYEGVDAPKASAFAVVGGIACLLAMVLLGRMYLAEHFFNKAADALTTAFVEESISKKMDGSTSLKEEVLPGRDWNEEIDLLHAAIAIDSSNYKYHLFLGHILKRNGRKGNEEQIREVLQEYRQAAELSPYLPNLHYSYGLCLLQNQQFLSGAAEVATAARLHPSSEEYQQSLKMVGNYIHMLLPDKRKVE